MNYGLSDKTYNKLVSVFEKYPEIQKVIIYGSRAGGNFKEGSDIDITLLGDNISDKLLSKIFWEVDDLDTPYLFDISIYSNLNNEFQSEIDKKGKDFYISNILSTK